MNPSVAGSKTRPPVRTTALRALSEGVAGDPAPLRTLRGVRLQSIDELLAGVPSGSDAKRNALSNVTGLFVVKPAA